MSNDLLGDLRMHRDTDGRTPLSPMAASELVGMLERVANTIIRDDERVARWVDKDADPITVIQEWLTRKDAGRVDYPTPEEAQQAAVKHFERRVPGGPPDDRAVIRDADRAEARRIGTVLQEASRIREELGNVVSVDAKRDRLEQLEAETVETLVHWLNRRLEDGTDG